MTVSPSSMPAPGGPPSGSGLGYRGPEGIRNSDLVCTVVGDTQKPTLLEFWRENNAASTRRLVDEIARRQPGFVLHLGDLTARGMSRHHWQHFDSVFESVREAGIPVLPVPGNHDHWGLGRRALRPFHQRFPFFGRNAWASFRAGGVGFVLLEGNTFWMSRKDEKEERQWFAQTLADLEADPEVRFLVLASHQPPYSNNRSVGSSRWVRESFAEPFQRSPKAAFFFSGHSHAYEHFRQGRAHFVVSGGGGGPRHSLALTGAGRSYPDLYDGPAVRFLHFCELRMVHQGLRLDVVRCDPDGSFHLADSISVPAGPVPPHPSGGPDD